MGNHWSTDGDLVIEEKTLFRQVGWITSDGSFYRRTDGGTVLLAGGATLSPLYVQIATWVEGQGWKD